MYKTTLPILNNPAIAERVSAPTRRALEQRVQPPDAAERYLPHDLYAVLQQVVTTILPQDAIGTDVDVAAAIDQRLRKGTNAGWRFADLPPDGEAYQLGLKAFVKTLEQTSTKSFADMPQPAREEYLRRVAKGDVDGTAQFPLSRWLTMLRTDVVRIWLSHPSAMQKLELYGFADGATGSTDGPTATEGWQAIRPNRVLAFEQGTAMPVAPRHKA